MQGRAESERQGQLCDSPQRRLSWIPAVTRDSHARARLRLCVSCLLCRGALCSS